MVFNHPYQKWRSQAFESMVLKARIQVQMKGNLFMRVPNLKDSNNKGLHILSH